MKKRRNWIAYLLIALTSLLFLSCETKDQNKLAGAQECLDKLVDSDPDLVNKAQSCENKIAGIESAESYVIRCSVQFIKGGIISSAIVNAFTAYKDANESEKTALLMNELVQNPPGQAELTYNACKKSEVTSLEFVAAASLSGSLIFHSGAGDQGTVDANLIKCANGGAGGVCNDTSIGTAIIAVFESYCVGEATSQQICRNINTAIVDSGGTSDPADIAIRLYDLLQ